MAGKVISTGNKDLSCLRCRKKKAKCSKTRPTCTRCSRSNQPCEYPDAPPNLTDLSQKVLTLYDTLKELEGEFLVKYMQTNEDEPTFSYEPEDPLPPTTPSPPTSQPCQLLLPLPPPPPPPPQQHTTAMDDEPAGWSMSLTPQGLSIHAITRNATEFNQFIKTLSRQVLRDFGPDYLPSMWDPDAEGYFDLDSDTEELDEDAYLVTVPVFSTRSLLHPLQPPPIHTKSSSYSSSCLDPTSSISHAVPYIIDHLIERYKTLLLLHSNTTVTHHLVQLMLQLKDYLNLSSNNSVTTVREDELSYICLLTAYVISKTFFPATISIKKEEDIIEEINVEDCIEYTKMIYLDYILRVEAVPSYQLILCSILLGWIENQFIPIAIRLLCNTGLEKESMSWQVLIASLVYLDIQTATFQFKRPQFLQYASSSSVRAAAEQEETKPTEREILIQKVSLLEGKLMCLLNKVVRLFYQVEQEKEQVAVRKIDVDEVLTLVRDMEVWEQELPDWAKWNVMNDSEVIIMNMHMIYNMIKILLFRPFSITFDQAQEEQTLTKITFLDMSIGAADKLATCLSSVTYQGLDHWSRSASNLVKDVTERVKKIFDKDEDIVDQLNKIQSRLQIKGKNLH
ncbi:hypothetical protein BD770DRAFT_444955 [Pilaira anomala]|nr:hypothetical protein BD770DRAFT_444955 [Pilaira anomala]